MSVDLSWWKGDLPSILENTKNILGNYILHPEISIHDPEPEILLRKPNEERLYYLPKCPASTTLIPSRDYVTGKILDFIEVEIEDAGANAKNSTSLQRAPGPLSQANRGSAMNFPFWPGGFDEPSKEIEALNIDIDFENNLLTIPPGFTEGLDFSNIVKENETSNGNEEDVNEETVNLLEVLEQGHEIQEWLKDDKTEQKINTDITKVNIDILSDDSIISNEVPPVLEIGKHKSTITKLEWAEMVDISQPIANFNEIIPEPAMNYAFELDVFQMQAILKLEERQHVFVAAHTSAGKTVVAEYAIALSQKHMTKAIYTSPIKALSNQKYNDFKKTFKDVGLITGDLQIEPTASCLIMTTEILRSMLYCGSDSTRDLEYVIFDEVHYINDQERGHVWEEVLILLPDHVNIIMLSATVPNTLEFANWVGVTKKRKVYVISTLKRPIPLMHYLYTGSGGKSRDDIFLIVKETAPFLSKNYREAVEKKQSRTKDKSNKPMGFKPGKHLKIGAIDHQSEDKSKKPKILKQDQNLWVGLIDHLKRNDKLPVVAFTLSRNRCDNNINCLESCDLNTERQKNQVRMFIQQCLQKLKEPDRLLPQVTNLQSSLERGIGVHHSGILPILKEIVEMLFTKGLVKLLFATETFAMGVNMPARTVVFDSLTKFDGNEQRMLQPAEYTQMAGRAGRRGHDKTGTVIIIVKNKFPSEVELQSIILGSPMKLESRFLLTYAMILTCLRLESLTVEDMMSHSFKEFHANQKIPEINKQLQIAEEQISNLKNFDENLKPLCKFYDVANVYLKEIEKNMKYLLSQQKVTKELKPGRVLIVSHSNHYNKLAIFLSLHTQVGKEINYNVLALDHEQANREKNKITLNMNDDKLSSLDRGDIWHKMLALTPQNKYFYPEGVGGHSVLRIRPSDVIEVTKTVIKIEPQIILQNWEQRQIPRFRDAPPGPSVVKAVTELYNLNTAYISEKSTLQFINLSQEINIASSSEIDIDFVKGVQNLDKLKIELKQLLPHTNIANFDQEFALVFDRRELENKLKKLEFMKSKQNLLLYPDYCSKLKVLRDLNYIDEQKEVTMKGRVACEMGQNELIIVELVLCNIFTNLDATEIAALFSSLVFQAKTAKVPKLNEKILNGIKKMEEVDNTIRKLEDIYGVTSKSTKERLNFGLTQVVYEWANNKPFAEIMEYTDVQEGIIVRCIQQLDEILRDVKTAAMRIGNPALQSKMEEASTAIKRDIVFAPSLYHDITK